MKIRRLPGTESTMMMRRSVQRKWIHSLKPLLLNPRGLLFNPFSSSSSSIGKLGHHDVAGNTELILQHIDKSESPIQLWEKQVHAMLGILSAKGLMNVDELRRGIEALPAETYENWTYYEKWAASM